MAKGSNFLQKVATGRYTYYSEDTPYSEERFEIQQTPLKDMTRYISTTITRLTTGELLKINCTYDVNIKWRPIKVIIKKSMGTKKVIESYSTDGIEGSLNYELQTELGKERDHVKTTGPYQIATPSIVTSFLCTQHRKVDPLSRTRYTLLFSQNDWKYEHELKEQHLYLESKYSEQDVVMVGDNQYPAKRCLMFQHDTVEAVEEIPSTVFLGDKLGIPLLLVPEENNKIVLDSIIFHDVVRFDDGSSAI